MLRGGAANCNNWVLYFYKNISQKSNLIANQHNETLNCWNNDYSFNNTFDFLLETGLSLFVYA